MIRPARESDLRLITRLEKQLFHDSWDYEQFYFELIANPLAHLMVFESKRRVVGYFDYWITGEAVEIATIAVATTYQKQGIGAKMLAYVEQQARANYAHYISLEVRVSNLAALALYQKCGFVINRTKRKYYPDSEDAYYMLKEL